MGIFHIVAIAAGLRILAFVPASALATRAMGSGVFTVLTTALAITFPMVHPRVPKVHVLNAPSRRTACDSAGRFPQTGGSSVRIGSLVLAKLGLEIPALSWQRALSAVLAVAGAVPAFRCRRPGTAPA